MKRLILLASILLLFGSVKSVMAQKLKEASPSGTPNSAETTQELKERIQRIVEQKSEQIKGAIDQISQQKRGFIGQVERVTEESLTITNTKGTEIIPFDKQVTLLKANQKISISDVAVGDWLVVMGLIVDDTFTPKRILVSSVSLRPKNHLVAMGTIIDQSPKEITILSRQNEEISFKINKQTEYQDQDGEVAIDNEFTKDIQVLIVANQDENTKSATIIRSLVSLKALQDNE